MLPTHLWPKPSPWARISLTNHNVHSRYCNIHWSSSGRSRVVTHFHMYHVREMQYFCSHSSYSASEDDNTIYVSIVKCTCRDTRVSLSFSLLHTHTQFSPFSLFSLSHTHNSTPSLSSLSLSLTHTHTHPTVPFPKTFQMGNFHMMPTNTIQICMRCWCDIISLIVHFRAIPKN